MNSTNVSDLTVIIKRIDENKILLPDFQREFVWRDVEQQRQIVASVLARMPIGSILLLKSSNPGEFSSKALGKRIKVNTASMNSEVEFLLDGQQRMTVLTNVFSNVLFKNIKSVKELASPTLKRRFFIILPRWNPSGGGSDVLGFHKLEFPVDNLGESPTYLSGDLLEHVVCFDFKANGNEPYNPMNHQGKLSDFCARNKDGYLVPLFLMASVEGKEQDDFFYITEQIKLDFCQDISDYFDAIDEEREKDAFCQKYNFTYDIHDKNVLKKSIEVKFARWWKNFEKYINLCITNTNLNQIVIDESQRGRAIDIYENLNRGGVSLNTFDLIMAKVAKVNNDNFYERLVEYINRETEYNDEIVPDVLLKELKEKDEYSASAFLGCYDEKKQEISSKYVDAFLNVLSLYCYNKNFSIDDIKMDYIKRNKILELNPEDINVYSKNVCIALDRACFFLNVRCGIRKISEVNNLLIFVLIAFVFIQDKYYYNKKIHELLEGWYWSVLFCGEFDKDQNKNFIKQMTLIMKLLNGSIDNKWLINMYNMILDTPNYSDKDLVLYQKIEDERYPKKNIRDYICQYLLAQTYNSLFNYKKVINVFCDEPLEAHHIMPLGSVKKLGQLSAALRKNTKHICNSPMNFIYITKSENKDISDRKINDYIQYITDEAKSSLCLKKVKNDSYTDDDILDFLENRFDYTKGVIKNKVNKLVNSI